MLNSVPVAAVASIALLIVFSFTQGAEYKFDVTVFDSSPLVGANSNEEYRVYLTSEDQDATVTEIGRSSNTGTGEVETVYQNPKDENSVPNGYGLPSSTSITVSSNSKWKRLAVTFPASTDSSRIGVFYATTVLGSDSLTIPIIKISETANITPNVYTKTIGIGESIKLSVTSTISNNLRWVHNNGEIITAWNDLTDVTLENMRLADAGIYECFEDGKRQMGQHAIMRLIVRACPSPKYGPDCSIDCRTCWNGGICAADNGVCLCQPGFAGDSCDQRLGSNTWGAKGSLVCSSRGGNCRTALICGPDPIGCSCVAGYTGLDCITPCPSGWYGSNCNRQCNCDSSDCDPAIGCREGSSCNNGYRDNQCQGISACDQGYFGAQCEFVCHCQGGGRCSKITGVCSNRACSYGWAGTDCQIALPYFLEGGQVTVNVTSTSATIIWNEWNKNIDFGTGPVDRYRVKYWTLDSTFNSAPFQTSTKAFLTITDLSPEMAYNFAVAAVRSNGLNVGSFGDEAFALTGCGAPTLTPTIIEAVQIGDDEAKLTWMIPPDTDWIRCSAGLSDFLITYSIYNPVTTIRAPTDAREHVISSLTPCMVYEFQIRATNINAEGSNSLPALVEIVVAPQQVYTIYLDDTNLSWKEPERVCEVTDYLVDVVLAHVDQCEKADTSIASDIADKANMILPQLQFYSTYEVTIQARFGNTTRGTGEANTMEFTTGESVPTGAPEKIRHTSPKDGTLMLTWDLPACGQRHGNIIMYEYEFRLNLNSEVKKVANTTEIMVLMSDLIMNKTYEFRVRAYTSEGSGPFSAMYEASATGPLAGSSTGTSSAVIGSVVGILLLLVIVFVLIAVVFKRRRSKAKDEGTHSGTGPATVQQSNITYENVGYTKDTEVSFETKSNGASSDKTAAKPKAVVKPIPEETAIPGRDQPVAVEGFMEYVEIKKAGGPDHELKKDFEALPKKDDELHPWTEAKKPENKTRNRYKNIIPYDHSRVLLEQEEGDSQSDYINASYINGYKKPKAYIAAQGPNSTTVTDIWRMIWQEKTETIIMVTGLVEGTKTKCEKYWPDLGKASSYGDYTVKNKQEDDKGFYVVRYFTLSKTELYANQASAGDETHQVKHFHYTGWPDMSVPEFSEPVLKFLDHMNSSNSADAGPVVVHCSAGIGRTGTFIAIDAMQKMAKAEGKVDVFNFVNQMRQQRPGMIQTEAQYTFVHDALLEALFCGNTTIPTSEVDLAWKNVEAAIHGEDNHILGQFKSLCSMFPAMSERQCAGGKQQENLSKNRFSTFIPPDSFRPKLSTPGDAKSNDYVSAAFCHGHEHRNIYLTTQTPLPHTVEDFWRLIFDYGFKTIVTLNDPEESNKTYGTYLPREGSLQRGQFVIESTSVDKSGNTTERTMQFHQVDKPSTVRKVNLIQYNDWPVDAALPSTAVSFVRLLDRVDVKRRDNEDQRIVVVDKDGVTRCGVFCTVMSVVDQIKEKQEVDVFRAVKRLKVCRHEMISTMAQYTFCYEAARAYLQAFETYANFS